MTQLPRDIILFATADWDYPFWTNKQHTAETLARLGFRVLYVDSLGSRQLRLQQSKDLKRIWARIKKLLTKPRQVQSNLWVWSPCILPVSESRWVQWINKKIFNGLLRFWMRRLAFRSKSIYWTYNPLTFLYVNKTDCAQLIYHCVDNIAEQPGAFVSLLKPYEEQLFKTADYVFVTSKNLEVIAKQYRSAVYYFPNVVDFDHFNQACGDVEIPLDLQSIPVPRVGFVGAVSAYKVNIPLLVEVAKQLPSVSFVLIGEVGEGDPSTQIEALLQLPNIYLLGPKSYAQLPSYLKGLSVCLIPANVNEYTKSMFPMKFFEYLAAGKPIVATDIPAIQEYAAFYYLGKNADEFASQIQRVLSDDSNDVEKRLALARCHTYLSRTQKMLECMKLEG